MQKMDLSGKGLVQTDWGEETRQCLINLNLLMSAYGERCENIGIPGGKAIYSAICDIIGGVNTGGPQRLDEMLDAACKRNAIFLRASRNASGR